MERLSGLDASFLYIETSTQPLNVCSILEVDSSTMPGGYTFDRLRDELALRIKAMPEFREKLADSQFNLDHPVWVEDKDFDVNRHLHRIGLPSPGGRAELAEICGHIASLPLDRSRPLWEMWLIEGVADTDADEGGLLAVMTKVHHAAVDGVTGASLLAQLCSVEPDAPPPDPVDGPGDASPLEIAARGLVRFAARPLQLATVLPTTVSAIVKTLHRARAGLTMAAPFAAPPTAFNAAVTAARNIAFTQLDLDDIKTVKNRFNVTVNDVVMALCAGVLRRFLHDRSQLPDKSLVAMVPVSVHEKSDRPGRNQLSGMFSRLETHVSDPAERLRAIAEANSTAKEHSSAIGPTLVQDWTQFAARPLFGLAMRLVADTPLTESPVHNLIISNVPGPRTTLYFLGCEVKATYPIGPIFHGSGLNITVMSLNGKLGVGVISCPDLLPDLWELADDFQFALDELLERAA
ncbi:MAG TPA: wax ester/triacylglycerol synthase family O-acyltransferase [Mycobacterium sp.]|nr:wax ester/triacylglycerol synthase family O-acyltransferase [Mycobacterium sp.]